MKNNEIKYSNGRYFCQIVNGIRDGKGSMYWNNGGSYEGDWKNNQRTGKGIEYWNDGGRYEGEKEMV